MNLAEVTSGGIQLYCREVLKKGNNYDICAVYENREYRDLFFFCIMRILL